MFTTNWELSINFLNFPLFSRLSAIENSIYVSFSLVFALMDNHKGKFIIQLFNHCLPLYQEVLRKSALLPCSMGIDIHDGTHV